MLTFGLALIGRIPGRSQTFTVLHNFTGGAAGGAIAGFSGGLILDPEGNLYGMTADGALSHGLVFKLDRRGVYSVLYNFEGGDGMNPIAGLFRDPAGNLYGTTPSGGASGHGVVFKLDANGVETVLHSFAGGADGGTPRRA